MSPTDWLRLHWIPFFRSIIVIDSDILENRHSRKKLMDGLINLHVMLLIIMSCYFLHLLREIVHFSLLEDLCLNGWGTKDIFQCCRLSASALQKFTTLDALLEHPIKAEVRDTWWKISKRAYALEKAFSYCSNRFRVRKKGIERRKLTSMLLEKFSANSYCFWVLHRYQTAC